jgi:hypothetical protein
MIVVLCYDPAKYGGGGFLQWRSSQDAEVRSAVDGALYALSQETKFPERQRYFKRLRGHCDGLDEVRIATMSGRLIRILGFKGPRRGEFTALSGFEKPKGKGFDYTPFCSSAKGRQNGIIRDNKRAKLYPFLANSTAESFAGGKGV